MLVITIEAKEFYDEKLEEFFETKKQTLRLEHSLVSLSKWEAKWQKPFLTIDDKTFEETIDYIRCMTITQNVDPIVYRAASREIIKIVNEYIEDPMSATTFSKDRSKKVNKEIVTSELIYFWMFTYNISWDCQKWHLNRLLTLINVCNIKNQPQKKMSGKEQMAQRRALNAARQKRFNTRG